MTHQTRKLKKNKKNFTKKKRGGLFRNSQVLQSLGLRRGYSRNINSGFKASLFNYWRFLSQDKLFLVFGKSGHNSCSRQLVRNVTVSEKWGSDKNAELDKANELSGDIASIKNEVLNLPNNDTRLFSPAVKVDVFPSKKENITQNTKKMEYFFISPVGLGTVFTLKNSSAVNVFKEVYESARFGKKKSIRDYGESTGFYIVVKIKTESKKIGSRQSLFPTFMYYREIRKGGNGNYFIGLRSYRADAPNFTLSSIISFNASIGNTIQFWKQIRICELPITGYEQIKGQRGGEGEINCEDGDCDKLLLGDPAQAPAAVVTLPPKPLKPAIAEVRTNTEAEAARVKVDAETARVNAEAEAETRAKTQIQGQAQGQAQGQNQPQAQPQTEAEAAEIAKQVTPFERNLSFDNNTYGIDQRIITNIQKFYDRIGYRQTTERDIHIGFYKLNENAFSGLQIIIDKNNKRTFKYNNMQFTPNDILNKPYYNIDSGFYGALKFFSKKIKIMVDTDHNRPYLILNNRQNIISELELLYLNADTKYLEFLQKENQDRADRDRARVAQETADRSRAAQETADRSRAAQDRSQADRDQGQPWSQAARGQAAQAAQAARDRETQRLEAVQNEQLQKEQERVAAEAAAKTKKEKEEMKARVLEYNKNRWKLEWFSQDGGSYKNIYTGEVKLLSDIKDNNFNILNYFLHEWVILDDFQRIKTNSLCLPETNTGLINLIIYYRHLINPKNWKNTTNGKMNYFYPKDMPELNSGSSPDYMTVPSDLRFFSFSIDAAGEKSEPVNEFSNLFGNNGLIGDDEFIMNKFNEKTAEQNIVDTRNTTTRKSVAKKRQSELTKKLKASFTKVKSD